MPVYTVSQLLQLGEQRPVLHGPLRPNQGPNSALGKYLSLWKEYNDLIVNGPRDMKPVFVEEFRYSFILSNRQFKRNWLRQNGSLEGLKNQKRFKLMVSHEPMAIKRHIMELRSIKKQLDQLRKVVFGPQALPLPESRFLPKEKQKKVVRRDNLKVLRPAKKENVKPSRVNLRVTKLPGVNEVIVDHLGGIAEPLSKFMFRTAPKREHTKYWYFRRKNGVWRPSDHHPYGDEIDYFDSQNFEF
jgi:hypothetical protein